VVVLHLSLQVVSALAGHQPSPQGCAAHIPRFIARIPTKTGLAHVVVQLKSHVAVDDDFELQRAVLRRISSAASNRGVVFDRVSAVISLSSACHQFCHVILLCALCLTE
jgi:hypothetical protein